VYIHAHYVLTISPFLKVRTRDDNSTSWKSIPIIHVLSRVALWSSKDRLLPTTTLYFYIILNGVRLSPSPYCFRFPLQNLARNCLHSSLIPENEIMLFSFLQALADVRAISLAVQVKVHLCTLYNLCTYYYIGEGMGDAKRVIV